MQELMTLYKLIILYMLARVDFPLTRIQINNFLLGREYTTNYLNIQQAMGELIDDKLVISQSVRNRLVAKEKGVTLIDLTLSIPAEETAAAICDNWMEKNQEIYQYLIGELF